MPILGLKTDVPPDDPSLFQFIGDNVALTYDTGGINFDVTRKRNTATRSRGYVQWSNSANSQATKCLGLFELYDGTNRNHIAFDNGRFFLYDSNEDANEAVLNFDAGTDEFAVGEVVTDDGGNTPAGTVRTVTVTSGAWATNDAAGTLILYNLGTGAFVDNAALTSTSGAAVVDGDLAPVAFANDDADLYSIERIGSYMVFSDFGEHRPYRWKHGDDYLVRLVAAAAAGENYQFRYLMSFARRLFGLHDTTSGVSDGDISIRWSDSWPSTAITALTYPSANQLYVPNDDPIVGGKTMGKDRAYVYCENSIQELIYYYDLTAPFRLRTIVAGQGSVNNASIINIGNRHFMFNKSYGFCEYRGGAEFPHEGVPISADIETNIESIPFDYYNLIVGKALPLSDEIVWTVPQGNTSPTDLFFYNIVTKQWRIEDKPMRCLDFWKTYSSLTWNAWTTLLGGSTVAWNTIGLDTWASYISTTQKMVYSNTDGQVYTQTGESLAGVAIDGYREEPILSFGDSKREDTLEEIWFDIVYSGNFSINVYYRDGNTAGEVVGEGWTLLGSISCNNLKRAYIKVGNTARLHQIRWGTDGIDEMARVSGITFRYLEQSIH